MGPERGVPNSALLGGRSAPLKPPPPSWADGEFGAVWRFDDKVMALARPHSLLTGHSGRFSPRRRVSFHFTLSVDSYYRRAHARFYHFGNLVMSGPGARASLRLAPRLPCDMIVGAAHGPLRRLPALSARLQKRPHRTSDRAREQKSSFRRTSGLAAAGSGGSGGHRCRRDDREPRLSGARSLVAGRGAPSETMAHARPPRLPLALPAAAAAGQGVGAAF